MFRLAACLLVALPLCGQLDSAAIERAVLAELAALKVPGAAIGIVQNGHLTYSKGFGLSNLDTGAPVTADMLFRLGSTTKMLTAAAVLSLPIDLKAPAGKYVTGLDAPIAALTLDRLLSHSAGLIDDAVMYGRHDDNALGEELRRWKASDWLFARPGIIHSYSNPGYWLAGFVAETVAGKPYADVMQDRIFTPLKIDRSTVRPTVAMTWPLSQGHDLTAAKLSVLRPAPDNNANWPAGSVFSNVRDMSQFLIAVMDGKFDALTKPRIPIPGTKSSYGYGLRIEDGIWSHDGSRAGYGSFVAMNAATHSAIVILCNRTGANLPLTRKLLFQMLKFPEPKALPPMTLDSHLTGSYKNGPATINLPADGKDVFSVQPPGTSSPFVYRGERAYVSSDAPKN